MNNQDLEKLKSLCEKEGFKVEVVDGTPTVSRFWDGVEFAKAGADVRRVTNQDSVILYFSNGNGYKSDYQPATEQEYIDYLKSEAKRLYGEIKEGDLFDRSEIHPLWESKIIMERSPISENLDFKYDKSNDTLFLGKFGIYKNGIWAKKMDRYDVGPAGGNGGDRSFYFTYGKKEAEKIKEIGYWNVCDYLAKCLEAKLNSHNLIRTKDDKTGTN
jgi:hypothetical protein